MYEVILGVHIVSMLWNISLVVISDTAGLLWVLGVTKTVKEKFLVTTHRLIWAGLLASILSGAYLFSTVSDYLLTVPAFYTKMFLVLALIINSFFIGRHIHLAAEQPFALVSRTEKYKLFISAGVSVIGWVGVLISANLLGL